VEEESEKQTTVGSEKVSPVDSGASVDTEIVPVCI
jgi:hypothetical protein